MLRIIEAIGIGRNGLDGVMLIGCMGEFDPAEYAMQKAQEAMELRVIDGVPHLVVKSEYYNEVAQLIKETTSLDIIKDRPIWHEIFAGGKSAFHRLSDSGKNILRDYRDLIRCGLEHMPDPSREVLHICNKLDRDNEECVNFIAMLNRTNIESFEINIAIDMLRFFALEMDICDECLAEAEQRIARLKEIIPTDQYNVKEPPEVMVPVSMLFGMMADDNAKE